VLCVKWLLVGWLVKWQSGICICLYMRCLGVWHGVSECECLHFIRHQVCVGGWMGGWESVVSAICWQDGSWLVYKVFIIICAHNLAEKGAQSEWVCSGVNEYVYIYSTWMCVTCRAFNFHKTAADAHPPDTTHFLRLPRRKSKSTRSRATIITNCAASAGWQMMIEIYGNALATKTCGLAPARTNCWLKIVVSCVGSAHCQWDRLNREVDICCKTSRSYAISAYSTFKQKSINA